jgi:hypothetical protein
LSASERGDYADDINEYRAYKEAQKKFVATKGKLNGTPEAIEV